MLRSGRRLIVGSLALLLSGCAGFSLEHHRTVLLTSTAGEMRWHGLPVSSGQVIVNEHPGATALFLSLSAAEHRPFVHAGIVVIEQGEAWVYESFGAFLPLPWASPNEYMGGGVRRVSLESFVGRGGIVALFEPGAEVDRAALTRFAQQSWRRRVPFDGRYDPADPSKFFCVEFVSRALVSAGGAATPVVATSRNPSMRVALDWLGIGGELQLAGDLVAGMRRTALLSRRFTAEQVDRYFELKRELHRRFTADQKLGSLFYWGDQGLKLRPAVDRYTDLGMRGVEEPRALADRLFGPLREQPARLVESR